MTVFKKNKKMKYIVSLLVVYFTISCNSQTLKEQFINNLAISSNSNVIYQHDDDGKVRVFYPTNLSEVMTNLVDGLNAYDLSTYSSGADCKKYLINYKVKTLNNNFISIQKSLSSMFCNSHDDIDYEVYNFFLTDDGMVYSINVKKNNYLIEKINKFLLNADVDCNYSIENIRLYLLFENCKPKLFIVRDKVCNEIIDLDINKLDFIFNNTSTNNFQKTGTFIVD